MQPDRRLNLDVDSPEKVIFVLLAAVDAFNDTAAELESAWQDKSAGKPWTVIAKELETAAARVRAALGKIGFTL